MADLIGSGLSFPLQADQRGVLALAHGVTDIEQAIGVILGTAPGERPMRPEFGCAVHDLMFDAIDAELIGHIESAIHTALARWEPRIEVSDVRVQVDSDDRSILYIDVVYAIRGSNSPRNLVFPFYTIPQE